MEVALRVAAAVTRRKVVAGGGDQTCVILYRTVGGRLWGGE